MRSPPWNSGWRRVKRQNGSWHRALPPATRWIAPARCVPTLRWLATPAPAAQTTLQTSPACGISKPSGRSCMPGLDFDLGGKLAVVTGGANGIGFAIAELLSANGASVAIFDLELENPQQAARQIGASRYAVDVTSRESLDAAFLSAGTPDIMIANAGIATESDFLEHT